jgi:hypothetical protein
MQCHVPNLDMSWLSKLWLNRHTISLNQTYVKVVSSGAIAAIQNISLLLTITNKWQLQKRNNKLGRKKNYYHH